MHIISIHLLYECGRYAYYLLGVSPNYNEMLALSAESSRESIRDHSPPSSRPSLYLHTKHANAFILVGKSLSMSRSV